MTKTEFLEAYRTALAAKCAWAKNAERLANFMVAVELTIRTEGKPWNHNSAIAKSVLKAAGIKDRPTLKALRALPD